MVFQLRKKRKKQNNQKEAEKKRETEKRKKQNRKKERERRIFIIFKYRGNFSVLEIERERKKVYRVIIEEGGELSYPCD